MNALKRNGFSLAVVMVFGLILSGCASTGTNFDASKRSDLSEGMSPAQVEETMGAEPENVTTQSGRVAQYTYSYSEAHSTPLAFVPIVGGLMDTTESSGKLLAIYFDQDERVERWNYTDQGDS